MANLTYRQATQEAPVSTTTKNAALTSQEIEACAASAVKRLAKHVGAELRGK